MLLHKHDQILMISAHQLTCLIFKFFFFYKHGYSRAQRAKAVKLCREGGDLLKTENTGGVIFLSFGKDPTHYSMWIHTPLWSPQDSPLFLGQDGVGGSPEKKSTM